MPTLPIHYVDLRTFCYATEDDKRVEAALQTFLPEDAEIERVKSEGHYGDRILVLSTRLENADDVRHVLSRLADLEAFDEILAQLDERVTKNCELFLRLSKQAAFNGDVRLGEGITFRAKVEAYPAKKPAAVENAAAVLEQLAAEGDV